MKDSAQTAAPSAPAAQVAAGAARPVSVASAVTAVGPSEADVRFMREALKETRVAAVEGEIPIGAVVVCRGRIIGKGHNMTERLHDPTAHAEMIAMTAATEAVGGKYLSDCTLYVTVEPCPMCAAGSAWCQVGRIVYGAPDPKRGYTLFSPSLLHPRTEVLVGPLADECSRLLSDWFASRRTP